MLLQLFVVSGSAQSPRGRTTERRVKGEVPIIRNKPTSSTDSTKPSTNGLDTTKLGKDSVATRKECSCSKDDESSCVCGQSKQEAAELVTPCVAKNKATDHVLWFNTSGQLISYPPETIQPEATLRARVNLDALFWAQRTGAVFNSWIHAVETITKNEIIPSTIRFGSGDYSLAKADMVNKMIDFINRTGYLPDELENYYLGRLNTLYDATKKVDISYAPSLDELVVPKYEMEFLFYDKHGAQITADGKPWCAGEEVVRRFCPCDKSKSVGVFQTDEIVVPKNCYRIEYRLTVSDNQVVAMMNWAANPVVKFPKSYTDNIVPAINKLFSAELIDALQKFTPFVEKLERAPLDRSIRIAELYTLLEGKLPEAQDVVGRFPNNNEIRVWAAQWLWATGGVPKINPFASAVSLLPDKPSVKVTAKEKSLYELFDNLVNKGVLKLSDLSQLDTAFKNIPDIKSRLDAEAKLQTHEPLKQNKYLYKGVLNVFQDKGVFMRHLDYANQYIVMATNPKSEIMEDQFMHILIENKPKPVVLSISWTATTISSDNSLLTDAVLSGAGDKIAPIDKSKKLFYSDVKRRDSVQTLLDWTKTLSALLKPIMALQTPPIFPIYYEKDTTANFETVELQHDHFKDPPAKAEYSVFQENADNTKKELVKGSYRINKWYRLRFKSGVVYSVLKQNDFTEVSSGQYTLNDAQAGIDGTFGIQWYVKKVDIRDNCIKLRPSIYVGFSMRKFTENFYVGPTFEPVSGLSISICGHFGRRELLRYSSGFPTGIKPSWGLGFAPALLIDPALFVKMFSLGSNRTLIGF